jgi:monofunctional glycosyltransferase
MKSRAKPKARASRGGRLVRWLFWLALGWVVVTVMAVGALRFVDPWTTAFMLERQHAASSSNEKGFVLRQLWVDRERMSPHLVRALVAAEDAHFTQHHGFDFDAMTAALEHNLDGKTKRGGSTLTQQLAKNLFLWPSRSVVRKAIEAYFTVLLEACLSKRRIIELHLNVAEYGNGLYGVEMASRHYFGKSSAALTPEEAAALVVVLPAPRSRRANAPSPAMRERSLWVLDQMDRLRPEQVQGL